MLRGVNGGRTTGAAAMGVATIVIVARALSACGDGEPASAPASDAGEDRPVWLGEMGLRTRTPVARPLHTLCGIASNPGDMPLGNDARSAALRRGYFDAAIDLGGVMIRRDFLWHEIEPDRGRFVWDDYDRLVDEAGARGVRLLGMLGYGVPWANPATENGSTTFPPADPRDFAAFAGATAGRYGGRVAAWEIWNEPNNGWRFWKPKLSGDPRAYGDLVAATHPAIASAAPGTPVLLAGTVFVPQIIQGAMPWLTEAYAARPDLARSFDIAGIHTYEKYPPYRAPELDDDEDPPLEAKIQMHAWLLEKNGGGDKPIWITEIGWPVWSRVDARDQARFDVRATILAANAGAEGIFWYTLRDGPHPENIPPEDAFGLLGNDQDVDAGREATPKPSYIALRALLKVVGERWPVQESAALEGLPADARAVVFRGASGGAVTAVWTVTTESATARIATGSFDVVGQDGASIGRADAGGVVSIGPDVTYLVAR